MLGFACLNGIKNHMAANIKTNCFHVLYSKEMLESLSVTKNLLKP